MDNSMLSSMFDLIDTLAHKQRFSGPELSVYMRGLSFAENYYELNSRMLERQLREMREEDENYTRDKERAIE